MGVVRDVTIDNLTQAVQGISSTGISDSTGQAINNTLGTLGKDTTLQTVNTQLNNVNLNLINVKNAINNLSFNQLFIVKTYTANWSWASGNSRNINLTVDDFNVSTPSGYIPISLLRMTTGALYSTLRSINISVTGADTFFGLNYDGPATISTTATVTIVYVKSNAVLVL